MRKSLMLFSGMANIELAKKVADVLDIRLGNAVIGRFSDGEINVEINENVRGADVFVLQPTCTPTNDNLMELLVLIDALKRASAGRITAVITYFGYARQDRRPRSVRVPISAKLVANMLTSAGINRLLAVDLHSDQIQGFFDIPVDNIYASSVLLREVRVCGIDQEKMIVVSPDTGGVARARVFAKAIGVDMAIVDKRRPKFNEAEVMNIIGDVNDKTCIIVDDMIDTANTLCKAAEALKQRGAYSVLAYATHAVLSGNAIERINNSSIDKVVLTDSIPFKLEAINSKKIVVASVANLIAETIRRINNDESISLLMDDDSF